MQHISLKCGCALMTAATPMGGSLYTQNLRFRGCPHQLFVLC